MKYLYLYCSVLLLSFTSYGPVYAQNIVNNGNFENYSICPSSYGQTSDCSGWRSYHTGTSDYFNSCTTSIITGVPVNFAGSQAAASGNAYVGGYCSYTGGYKEYIAGTMGTMSVGTTYKVSMSVSLGEVSGYACNGLGIWFYKNGPSTTTNGSNTLPVTPQVFYPDTIRDETHWIRLTKIYVADSAYDNLVIGDFLSVPYTVAVGSGSYAYYYFDSIEVKPATDITPAFTDTALCVGDSIIVPFTIYNGVYSNTNTFTLQLSDDTGSFAHATSVATLTTNVSGTLKGVIPTTLSSGTKYKFRIMASSPVDSSAPSGYVVIGNIVPAKPVVTGNTPICEGDTLRMQVSSTTSGVAYRWARLGSFYSNYGSSIVIYPALPLYTGTYIGTAWLMGCKASDTIAMTVNPLPVYTMTYNSPLCQADTLKIFPGSSFTGVSYSWTGPNSYTSTSANALRAHIGFADTGYYVGTATLNGCTYRDSINVRIKPLPQSFTILNNSPQCQGNTLSMSGGTSSTGVTWAWRGPNSFSSTAQSISFTNAQPSISGDYILAATLNGCTAIDTLHAHVIAIPASPSVTANTPVCVGQALNLGAGGTGPGFIWSGPNSFTSFLQNPVINNTTVSAAGTYNVHAIDGGCTSADVGIVVTVIPAPSAGVYPSPGDSICQGNPVTLHGFAGNAGTGYTFRWFRNGLPISAATGIQYTDTHAADYDTYYCTVTSNGTCTIPFTDTSNVIVMRVFPWLAPSVSITTTATGNEVGGDLISFTATPVNGGNAPAYQWKRNNKNELGATSYTWGAKTLSDKDVVCVEMTSSYLCPQPKTANSNCITVRVNTTGIANAELMQGIKIYPNPVTDELVIEGIAPGITITLTDVLGRVLLQTTSSNATTRIQTSALVKGTYLLKLTDADGRRANAKLVKE